MAGGKQSFLKAAKPPKGDFVSLGNPKFYFKAVKMSVNLFLARHYLKIHLHL